ncbi:MAG: thioredoxin domain-containing protein [Armatimonadota bacterium]|nr:thioredoxin domain-containing protein [Armatimonadota bacterium]
MSVIGLRKFPSPSEINLLPPDGGAEYNRLVFEASPYLRQHAANPVDWYPWGEEAFARARSENKPVFLSIGYSTCHWCHVMEHESFEDAGVAELLSRKFIAIKLDREERPDLDHQYMAVTQAMQSHGGWPNSLFLTPNAEPFFAFTYLPKEQFMGVLSQISELWETQMMHVAGRAVDIANIVGGSLQTIRGEGSLQGVTEGACQQLLGSADIENGGFGHAPKFPHADDLTLLTRCGDDDPFVALTLTKMRQGGIYDQLAGGFHRYSTDEKWLLPHFEKMLYDQASMVNAYTEAYAKHGTTLFKETAIEVLDFVDKYLSHEDGSFMCAIDADSEGEEGKSYVWTEMELEETLGEDAEFAKQSFGTTPEGNFLEERSRERTGANVLTYVSSRPGRGPSLERSASGWGEGDKIRSIRAKLLEARNKRVQPITDDKSLTDWNGMMIAAMARASVILEEPHFARRAAQAAETLLARFHAERKVTHSKGQDVAFLDDYAFFIFGLMELHQADFDTSWLRMADKFAGVMLADFEDKENGGFFMTRDVLPGTGARPKVATDSAHRSGYAVAAGALVRLGRVLQKPEYIDSASRAIDAASGDIAAMPTGHTGLLLAHQELEYGKEVVVVGATQDSVGQAINEIRKAYSPIAAFLPVYPGCEGPEFAISLRMVDNKTTFYVCRNFACELPTADVEKARRLLM